MQYGLSSAKRVLLIGIGCLSTGLGLVGVWVPGLPTTIFMIVALWAFTRSSERLYAKLWRIKLLQPALRTAETFHQEKIIEWRVKCIALAFAWGSFILMLVLTQSAFAIIFTLAGALVCTAVMVKYPSRRASDPID